MAVLAPGQSTPAPWINVIANPNFGFQVGTEGGGSTWSANSRENQLTPWSNDPVTDRSGEALYLRDLDSGDLWSATALPIRDEAVTYVARHGRGYSRFTHNAHEIAIDLRQFVPIDDPIKISRLRLHNRSKRVRNLSVTGYVQWILAASHQPSATFITTEIDPADRRNVCAEPLEHSLRFANRVRRHEGASGWLDRRSAGIHRSQWNACEPSEPDGFVTSLRKGRCGSRSLQRHECRHQAPAGRECRNRILCRPGGKRRASARDDCALSDGGPRRCAGWTLPNTGRAFLARFRSRPRIVPWISC